MKRIPQFFGILLLILLLPAYLGANSSGSVTTVVIDPGHGGRDPGAIGTNTQEKHLTLAIGLKLGEYINEYLEDVEVIYTRESDVFVPLHERARIANDNDADLFISLHCNSSRSRSARGTETFVMGLHRSQANLEVARRENKAILYEDDYLETYDGFDPHSPEANIIFALYQNAYLDQSLNIASMVQTEFKERARRNSRGVKQAGFLVLYEVTMPGVLVEAGFLSNPNEERYLMSESGQAYIASAIFRAFRDYKKEQDTLAASRKQYTASLNQDKEAEPAAYNEDKKSAEKPVNESAGYQTSDNQGNNSAGNISFRVQFAVTSEKKPVDDPAFSPLKDVALYQEDGLYKYTVGDEQSLEDAAEIQQRVQEAGFKDAFVVAFWNGERISASEALQILNE
ncbi:MAG: N-acetylmuramoyl-L-alanine amidase [Bacteroidales bacterium]